jgi:hypothetical protein
MTPGPEYHEQLFYDLIGKIEAFTDGDIQRLRDCLKHTNFNMLRNHVVGKAQLRVDVEAIESIRRFDEASGKLVQTTNSLTKKGLWLSGAAIAVALASLGVSLVALLNELLIEVVRKAISVDRRSRAPAYCSRGTL